MNKKIFYYILIGLGALDLIIWVLNGFSFGWLELIVGVNGLSKYGAWIMIATGIWLLKKEKAKEKSEIDAVADLETGEEIIFKNAGNTTILTLTSLKIIYRAFNVEENTIKQNDNVIADEKAIQIFDGEKMRPPAPDYRLFLLRDGRLLHYAGGFHADGWREPVVSCGHVLTVLEAMGDGYGSFGSSSRWLSFMIIMDSVNSALEAAIAHRQRTLDEQQALHAQLTQLVKRIR
jgi:hypothetical protein